ncbi:MAG: CDP-glycerol glycerophosphotransferase family protein, partial [Clostridiales Family XIII bacterium]|nr:CDP-glycerol glycerophosphotransferase family protein [Clostridiales Family XIII bacterium]
DGGGIASAIRDALGGAAAFTPDEKYLAFKRKYTCLDDGGATARLVGRVWGPAHDDLFGGPLA